MYSRTRVVVSTNGTGGRTSAVNGFHRMEEQSPGFPAAPQAEVDALLGRFHSRRAT